jgi:anaerobic ribonucleoside-triphosphate reductase activating protein
MGGDQDADYVATLAKHVHESFGLKTAWYTGQQFAMTEDIPAIFDFVKTGPYVETLGGLKSPTTNQRFYRHEGTSWIDETEKFHKTRH